MGIVKCRDNGMMIPEEKAFTKSSKSTKNKVWFSSEEAYEWWHKWNGECIKRLSELCLDKDMKFPSVAAKMLVENGDQEVTYMAIDLAEGDIQYAIGFKEFYNDFGKWKYLFTIINKYYNEATAIKNARAREEKKEDYIPEDDSDIMPIRKAKNKAVGGFLL